MKKAASSENALKSKKEKSVKSRKKPLDAIMIQENMDELKEFLARHRVLPQNSDAAVAVKPSPTTGDLFHAGSGKHEADLGKHESPASPRVYETFLLRKTQSSVSAAKKKR